MIIIYYLTKNKNSIIIDILNIFSTLLLNRLSQISIRISSFHESRII
jgi:hypothetical protein